MEAAARAKQDSEKRREDPLIAPQKTDGETAPRSTDERDIVSGATRRRATSSEGTVHGI
jgi:hypothetical protein